MVGVELIIYQRNSYLWTKNYKIYFSKNDHNYYDRKNTYMLTFLVLTILMGSNSKYKACSVFIAKYNKS